MNSMYIPGIGNLTFEKSILSYDYPIVFTCVNDYGSQFLFYEVDADDNFEKWIVAPMDRADYFKLCTNKTTLGGFYRVAGNEAFVINHDFASGSYEKASVDTLAQDDFPCDGFYVGHDGPDESFAKSMYKET